MKIGAGFGAALFIGWISAIPLLSGQGFDGRSLAPSEIWVCWAGVIFAALGVVQISRDVIARPKLVLLADGFEELRRGRRRFVKWADVEAFHLSRGWLGSYVTWTFKQPPLPSGFTERLMTLLFGATRMGWSVGRDWDISPNDLHDSLEQGRRTAEIAVGS